MFCLSSPDSENGGLQVQNWGFKEVPIRTIRFESWLPSSGASVPSLGELPKDVVGPKYSIADTLVVFHLVTKVLTHAYSHSKPTSTEKIIEIREDKL